jgi:predicted PhzF superfamily epimerase YddE/YHI9
MKRELAGLPIYQVDAFAEKPFEGNPAAVCLLNKAQPADWMQSVGAEMNLSETAFVRRLAEGYELRWFTPIIEVELCGHATLAAAHIIWSEGLVSIGESIRFHTKSGILTCHRVGEFVELNFPAMPVTEAEAPPGLLEAFDIQPSFIGRSKFDLFVVESEEVVRTLKPDFNRLRSIPGLRGVIVSSRSTNPRFDFISRFFAPAAGIDEDPVTGSAHCSLAPFWSERLGKPSMTAYQASRRGGVVRVRLEGDRVVLGGQAVTVMRGNLHCRDQK